MLESGKSMPSVDAWLREAKADASAAGCGMYLTHNGVVRATPKAEVRGVETDGVAPGHRGGGMVFDYDAEKVRSAIETTRATFRGNIPSFQAFFIHFINTLSINNQSLMHLFFPFSFIVFIQTGILS